MVPRVREGICRAQGDARLGSSRNSAVAGGRPAAGQARGRCSTRGRSAGKSSGRAQSFRVIDTSCVINRGETHHDEVQARVHLARRVHACPQPARQDADQGIRRFPTLEQLPLWGFDGSSTMQAEGHSSDCVLKPVAVYPDGARTNGVLVMCEVMMPDGKTPHASNKRATILDDAGAWFGFEQEYFFYKDGRPLGFPEAGYPAPQGPYYTGVGYKNVGDVARKIVEEHLDLCLAAGINHEGINAEVAKGQWEFQIFGKGSKTAADEMWMARYLMLRLTEKYGIDIEFHCKPLGDTDWNGSGMHCNFSTELHARSRRQGLLRGADGSRSTRT